jgi:hypothetical protein
MWRASDEALLARLEDQAALERLWRHAVPGGELPHPRASGMIALLREGGAATTSATAAALLATASGVRLERADPRLAHHLALFHGARAAALAGRSPTPALEKALASAIAAWLATARGTWLADLAARAGAPASAIAGAPLRGIDLAAELARSGIGGPASRLAGGTGGSRALAALSRIDDAIAASGCSADLAARARARAAAARSAIVADLLAPLSLESDALAAREWAPHEVSGLFERALEAWQWAGEEAEIEHFVVREIPRFAWDLYRARKWADLRSILRPLEAPSDRLARRIEAEPRELAWAAQCAQVIVFRAELATTLDAQIALAERGLRVCPTLRNARLVLADLLCARAERKIEQPLVVRSPDAMHEAARDVERAAQIFPELPRLAELKKRLARRGVS